MPTPPNKAYIAAFQSFYKQFMELMALKPWLLIEETVILGVQHPQTGEKWYAYFMGEAGEMEGFNVYGAGEIGNWLRISEMLHSANPESPHTAMILQTFYQLTAETKSNTEPELIQLHKSAGIKVEKRQNGYLDALSYRTGYMPLPVTEGDIELLQVLLPGLQFLLQEVAAGRQNAMALDILTHTGHAPIAIPKEGSNWEVEVQPIPAAQPQNIYATAENNDLIWESLRPLPRTKAAYMIHAGLLPLPFPNANGESAFPIMMMLFDAENGAILGTEQVPVNEWKEEAAATLANLVKSTGSLPVGIVAGETDFLLLVKSMCKALEIELNINEEMNAMGDEIFADFVAMMEEGGMN